MSDTPTLTLVLSIGSDFPNNFHMWTRKFPQQGEVFMNVLSLGGKVVIKVSKYWQETRYKMELYQVEATYMTVQHALRASTV